MCHLPHCIICLVCTLSVVLSYSIYSVCTSVPTLTFWVPEEKTHSFRTSQLPIHFPAAFHVTLSRPSFGLSGRPFSAFLLLLIARLSLPASGLQEQPSFFRSGVHSYTFPFHPWSCPFSKSAGTPYHLPREVFTSRSADSSLWP